LAEFTSSLNIVDESAGVVVKQRSWKAESPSSTLRHTSGGIPIEICERVQFWFEAHRKWVRRYDATRL
jgi:hypothetical protein